MAVGRTATRISWLNAYVIRGRNLSVAVGFGQVPWNVWIDCCPRSFFIGIMRNLLIFVCGVTSYVAWSAYICSTNGNAMKNVVLLTRYLLIINKLQREKGRYVMAGELLQHVNRELEYRGHPSDISLRTLQRDIADVCELGFPIEHKHNYGYCLQADQPVFFTNTEEMLLNFDLLNAINSESADNRYILAEHHRPVGSEQMPLLIDAIRKQHPIKFDYTLVRHNDNVICVNAHPHFLKESNQRWYLLAKVGDTLKSYGIDRIANIEVMEHEKFKRDQSINIDELFRDSYGIWQQTDIPVEDIELSYDALDGKFLKSLPLHHSQRIVCDTDEEFRITLRLRITNDFVMELLSRSRSLTVIRPLHLRERVHQVYQEALKRNRL